MSRRGERLRADHAAGATNRSQTTAVRISTDPAELDIEWVYRALSERAYWALGRTRDQVERAIAGSITFAAFDDERQVGFARVITDQATFAWVCDVFVDEGARGQGIGNRLIAAVVGDSRLEGLRLVLATRDAHGLYERHGFRPLVNPERWMERPRPAPAGGAGPR